MRARFSRGLVLGIAAGTMMAAAAQSGTPLASPKTLFVRSTVSPAIYVADPATNSVYVYTTNGVLTNTLTGFNSPAGLAVDNKGNLYVSDQGNQVVKAYAPGSSTPFITLDDSGYYPTGIVTDGADNVYVASLCSGSPGTVHCTGNGSVYKFPVGSTTHTTVYKNSAIEAPYYVAFEKNGHLLWADGWTVEGGKTPVVGYWTKPSTFVASTIAINWPGGMQFDKNDNLAVDDQVGTGSVSTLYVFPHGSPPASSSFPLWTETGTNCDVVSFAIAESNTSIWTACFKIIIGRRFLPGVSQEIAYPLGGSPIKSIANGKYESGIAVAPLSGN